MRKSWITTWLLAGWISSAAGAAPLEATVEVPVAPIAASVFQGWTNAFVLKNPLLEVVIVPEIGRMIRLAPKGESNLLRLDDRLAGRSPEVREGEEWLNFGGNWLWPVAQTRWPMMSEREWPPPPPLAEEPWSGSAWQGADDSQYCLLTRTFGPPVNLKVSRLFKLDRADRRVTIRQRAERAGRSSIPVSLWTVTQVDRPDQLILPVDESTTFEGGYKPLLFGNPPEELLTRLPGILVYRVQPGQEHKVGTDSERGWIAARRGRWMLVQRFAPEECEKGQPDDGCTVEMYAHADLGYAEMQTLSDERALGKGRALQHNVAIECWPIPSKRSAEEAIAELRQRLGEGAEP